MEVDEFEEYDVASSLLEMEEEKELIEHFLALQIEKDEAAAQMDVQEEASNHRRKINQSTSECSRKTTENHELF